MNHPKTRRTKRKSPCFGAQSIQHLQRAHNVEYVRSLLTQLPKQLDFFTSMQVISVITKLFDHDLALSLLLEYFPDQEPSDTERKMNNVLKHEGIRTLQNIVTRIGSKKCASRTCAVNLSTVSTGLSAASTMHTLELDSLDTTNTLHSFASQHLRERMRIEIVQNGKTPTEAIAGILSSNPEAKIDRMIRFSVNKHVTNKPMNFNLYTHGFENVSGTVQDLAQCIKMGYSFCPSILKVDESGCCHRRHTSWLASELIALDINRGMTIERCLSLPMSQNASLLHTTCRHTPEQNRYRLLFVLPYMETDPERYKRILSQFTQYYSSDGTRGDLTPGFFGNTNSEVYLLENGEVQR